MADLAAPLTARPLATAIGLAVAWVVVADGGFQLTHAALPDVPPLAAAIVPLAILAILVAILLTAARWWTEAGVNGPRQWRELHLLALPTALTLLPFAGGINREPVLGIPLLLIGYALTGFAEEAFARGLLLRVLRPSGPVRALIVSSLLFGLMHLGNVLIRGNPAIIAAQAVGAACFGAGYAALRLRTNTFWPLMVLHMLTDLFLRLGGLATIPTAVAQDVILLAYAAYLMRAHAADRD